MRIITGKRKRLNRKQGKNKRTSPVKIPQKSLKKGPGTFGPLSQSQFHLRRSTCVLQPGTDSGTVGVNFLLPG